MLRRLLVVAMVALCGGLLCSTLAAAQRAERPAKYARFQVGQTIAYGVVEGDQIRQLQGDLFGSREPTDKLYSLAEVKLLVPVEPKQVLAMAVNYKSHAPGEALPEKFKIPQPFWKPVQCLIAAGENIIIPADAEDVHYEAEMVIVIGREAHHVSKERALDYVLGVTCGNDVSERVWQKADHQWWRAKGADTFGPVGPFIVSGLDYDNLLVTLRLNGEVKQQQRTADLVHGVADIVSFISRYTTLQPGDLIFTGTPGKTGPMKPGDRVEVEVEGVGTLVNTVVAAPNRAKTSSPASDDQVDSAGAMAAQRKQAASRRRRIIFNNDGAEPTVKMTSPSAKEFLDLRTTDLVGTQVDSVFYCPRCSGFGMFTYPTKVGEVFATREGRYANNQTAAMIAAGIDPLKTIVDFCKQHQIEVFCSFRMNDNHDGTSADYAPLIFRANKFKQAHPELLLGTIDKRPKIGAWAAVDYGRPEIRELAFRFAEEVCHNYDVDGIELDFFRHAVYFKSTTRGEQATDEERDAMTALVARIRQMADQVGQARRRPILIAIRCPDSVEYCHAMGLDLERWLREGLLDLYIPAGTFQLNNWDYSVALARKHGVMVYPSLDDSRVRDPLGKQLRLTELAYRGRAANVWAAGADGVYLYNFFDHLKSDAPLLNEMGSPEKLAKLDKDYLPAARGIVNTSAGNLPYAKYLAIETLNPQNPKKIAAGKSASANILLAETPQSLHSAKLTLRLRFEQPLPPEELEATFNGRRVALTAADDQWLEAPLERGLVEPGENRVEISLLPGADTTVAWLDLNIQVRHSN